MRSFIVASVLAVLLMLFVATVTDVSHDAAETQTVLTVVECPCNLAGCTHAELASNYDSGFCEAQAAEAVLKLPSESIANRTKHEFISSAHGLKLLHYNGADEITAASSRGHFSVGVLS